MADRDRYRSLLALFAGFAAVLILSLGTDQLLHMAHVYPPWDQPMRDPLQNLLALVYRTVYGILGSYITARLAPHSPMRHALIGGLVGFILSGAGVVAAFQMDMGPRWYPIALWVTAMPCAWVGGRLYMRRRGG